MQTFIQLVILLGVVGLIGHADAQPSDVPTLSVVPSSSSGPSVSEQPSPDVPSASSMPSSSSLPSISILPSKSIMPSASLMPSASSLPSKSIEPSSNAPSSSSQPSTSGQPSTSSLPSKSNQPSISGKPSSSALPSASTKPSASQNPSSSAGPSTSNQPSVSAQPFVQPSVSEIPSISSRPSTSSTPSTSVLPSTSNQPSISNNPSVSSQPSDEQPSTSSQPSLSELPTSQVSAQPSAKLPTTDPPTASLPPTGTPPTTEQPTPSVTSDPTFMAQPTVFPTVRPSTSFRPSETPPFFALPSTVQPPVASLAPSSGTCTITKGLVLPVCLQAGTNGDFACFILEDIVPFQASFGCELPITVTLASCTEKEIGSTASGLDPQPGIKGQSQNNVVASTSREKGTSTLDLLLSKVTKNLSGVSTGAVPMDESTGHVKTGNAATMAPEDNAGGYTDLPGKLSLYANSRWSGRRHRRRHDSVTTKEGIGRFLARDQILSLTSATQSISTTGTVRGGERKAKEGRKGMDATGKRMQKGTMSGNGKQPMGGTPKPAKSGMVSHVPTPRPMMGKPSSMPTPRPTMAKPSALTKSPTTLSPASSPKPTILTPTVGSQRSIDFSSADCSVSCIDFSDVVCLRASKLGSLLSETTIVYTVSDASGVSETFEFNVIVASDSSCIAPLSTCTPFTQDVPNNLVGTTRGVNGQTVSSPTKLPKPPAASPRRKPRKPNHRRRPR
jgi:hypothetical protein